MPRLKFLFLFVLTVSTACADLTVTTLNCYLYFSPANHERTGMKRETLAPQIYQQKTENLAGLILKTDADFVGLQEIGSQTEAQDLAGALQRQTNQKWTVIFAQGRDTYTGEDVAALVRHRAGIKVQGHGRIRPLDKDLSKHLVVTLMADGTLYDLCIVHLIRPIQQEATAKHNRQVNVLRTWLNEDHDATAIVLGDFNDINRNLVGIHSANELTGWTPTHASNKTFDHIYANRVFKSAKIVRPPYGPKPNDESKTKWTDHYALTGKLP